MPDVTRRFAALCWRLAREDAAQDLLEYAFLAAFISVAGYVVLSTIGPAVNAAYATWIDPSTGSPQLWEPPDPGVAGS